MSPLDDKYLERIFCVKLIILIGIVCFVKIEKRVAAKRVYG